MAARHDLREPRVRTASGEQAIDRRTKRLECAGVAFDEDFHDAKSTAPLAQPGKRPASAQGAEPDPKQTQMPPPKLLVRNVRCGAA